MQGDRPLPRPGPSTVANEVARHRFVTLPRSIRGLPAPEGLGECVSSRRYEQKVNFFEQFAHTECAVFLSTYLSYMSVLRTRQGLSLTSTSLP